RLRPQRQRLPGDPLYRRVRGQERVPWKEVGSAHPDPAPGRTLQKTGEDHREVGVGTLRLRIELGLRLFVVDGHGGVVVTGELLPQDNGPVLHASGDPTQESRGRIAGVTEEPPLLVVLHDTEVPSPDVPG